jgi:hypothetical protein
MIPNPFYHFAFEIEKMSQLLATDSSVKKSTIHIKKCRELTCVTYNKQLGKKRTAYKLRE